MQIYYSIDSVNYLYGGPLTDPIYKIKSTILLNEDVEHIEVHTGCACDGSIHIEVIYKKPPST